MNNDTWVVTPDTDIELLKLNLQIDNKNQLTFESREAQEKYFSSLDSYKIEDSTFQRNDATIDVELPFEEMINYTYCRYKNKNKWYYAFITDVTYINEYVTSARLVTDVWQTYQFDLEYGVSFIERCHATNDEIGAQLIPEELETGEYVINKQRYVMEKPFEYNTNGYYICMESTRSPLTTDYKERIGGTANGLYTALPKYLYENTELGVKKLSEDITAIMGKSLENNENAIQNIYVIHPLALGLNKTEKLPTPVSISENEKPFSYDVEMEQIKVFDFFDEHYTPINKKLLTYPYVYYKVSNGNGTANIYRQEDFSNKHFTCKIYGMVCPGNNIKLVPIDYKNVRHIINVDLEDDYLRKGVADESISLGKLPILNWGGDTYTAWMVNNELNQYTNLSNLRSNQRLNLLNANTNAVASGSNPNAIGSFIGGLTGLLGAYGIKTEQDTQYANAELNQLQEKYLANLVPPNIGGNKDVGDINTVSGYTDFCIEAMTIKPRQARVIDGYFYKYGYKVNDNDIIRINTRSKFNYIKTIGAVITGDVPQMYLEVIKSMFNNGVTLWHNPNTFMKYSASYNDNPIIS